MTPVAWNATRLVDGPQRTTEIRGKWINYADGGTDWRRIDTAFRLDSGKYLADRGPWSVSCPDSATGAIVVANQQYWDCHEKTPLLVPPLVLELSHPGARPVSPVVHESREWQVVYPDAIDEGIDIAVGQWQGRGTRAEHLYVIRRVPPGNQAVIPIICHLASGDISLPIPNGQPVPIDGGFSARMTSDERRGVSIRPTVGWYYDDDGKLVVEPIAARIRRLRPGVAELVKLVPRALIERAVSARPGGELRVDTTTTFYPDPHTETTSVDGNVLNEQTNVSWATLRNATGGTSILDSTSTTQAIVLAGTTSWNTISRLFALFDTSAIGDTDTIDSGTLSLYGQKVVEQFSPVTAGLAIYASTPASNTALVTGDYDQVGTTLHSDTVIAAASFSTSGYNDFALNATGLAAISKTGVSKFGARIKEDADDSPPTWSASKQIGITTYAADQAGTANDPKLVIVHTTPPASGIVIGGGVCVSGGVG